MGRRPLQRYLKLKALIRDSFLHKVMGPVALWVGQDTLEELERLRIIERKTPITLKVDAMWRAGVFNRLIREGYSPRMAARAWDLILYAALHAEPGSSVYRMLGDLTELQKARSPWEVKTLAEKLALEYGFEEHYVYLVRYYRMGAERVEAPAPPVRAVEHGGHILHILPARALSY